MKVSELITLLQHAQAEQGDLLISTQNDNTGWNHVESVRLIPECKDGPKRLQIEAGEWVIDSSDRGV